MILKLHVISFIQKGAKASTQIFLGNIFASYSDNKFHSQSNV